MNKMPPAAARARTSPLLAILLAAALSPAFAAPPGGAASVRPTASPASPVVTDDIREGIEAHIARESEAGGGFFRATFEGRELALKLVRVHTEYLATLAPERHFACVDMASDDGRFFDLDFFLEGPPGGMRVTETTVHKLDGRPFYLWKRGDDGRWGRAPVDDASRELLGVRDGRDAFEFRYLATLPALSPGSRLWIPLAGSDDFQTAKVVSVATPVPARTLTDAAHGNKVLFMELGPAQGGGTVEIVYEVTRLEKGAYPGDPGEAARHLAPERFVPADPRIRASAERLTARGGDDLMRARALYDHVLESMRYIKFGDGWGRGDAVRACDARSGNCTDFHAYFIALARAIGIPARFAIGAAIPSERDDGGTDGYHCWAEFFAAGKWWPVDISEADKFCALSSYYFGHHPANRFELSRGRDLLLDPGPADGPINFLAYPHLEVDGKAAPVRTRFLFRRPAHAVAEAPAPPQGVPATGP